MHALSIPTWIIHVASVIEWIAAIALVWKYGEVTMIASEYIFSCQENYFSKPCQIKSLEVCIARFWT